MTPIRMPRYRYENSPKHRERMMEEGFGHARGWSRRFFQRPPFGAVRALLFSCGYVVLGSNAQKPRWDTHKAYDWVPMRVSRAGVECTRWVRALPGRKMEVSDGTEVPMKQKLSCSIALLKSRQQQKGAQP